MRITCYACNQPILQRSETTTYSSCAHVFHSRCCTQGNETQSIQPGECCICTDESSDATFQLFKKILAGTLFSSCSAAKSKED